jgi:hypothetical protein
LTGNLLQIPRGVDPVQAEVGEQEQVGIEWRLLGVDPSQAVQRVGVDGSQTVRANFPPKNINTLQVRRSFMNTFLYFIIYI